MIALVTIRGADKTGALARFMVFFSQKRFSVKGHQVVESASGEKLRRFKLDVIRIDKDELAAEISGLGPDFSLVDVTVEGSAATEDGAKKALARMANQFPDIAPLVLAYAGAFAEQNRGAELFQAGKKIGAFHYAKDWSFGSPLKMPVALRRSLVPALEKLAKVNASDSAIAILQSPLCTGGKDNCCQFLAGFAQGFLDAGPGTKNTRVTEVACRAKGAPHCQYAFEYQI